MNYRFLSVLLSFCLGNTLVFANFKDLPQLILDGKLGQAEDILLKMSGEKEIDPLHDCFEFRDVEEKLHRMSSQVPELSKIEEIFQKDIRLSEKEYLHLVSDISGSLKTHIPVSKKDQLKTLDAYYRLLDDLSIIKSKVKFEERKKEKKDKEENKDLENPWEQSIEKYKPRNKPFSSDGGNAKDLKPLLIQTNAPLLSPLMGTSIFDTISSEGWTKSMVGRRSVYKETQDVFKYRVFTYGQNNIPLPVPLGYRPVLTEENKKNGISLGGNKEEEFILSYEGDVKEIDLQLVRLEIDPSVTGNSVFKRKLFEKYANQESGIDKQSWPSDILQEIKRIEATADNRNYEKALALRHYIKENYKYYSQSSMTENEINEINSKIEALSKQGLPMPIIFCQLKTIQCDGAAWIMASLLRDFFKIPVRVVSGRTAVKRGAHVVVRANDPLHAWVQVWDDQKGWQEIDATPAEKASEDKKKEKKDKKTKEKNNDKSIGAKEKAKKRKEKTDSKDQEMAEESLLSEYRKKNKDASSDDYLADYIHYKISTAASFVGNPKEKKMRLEKIQTELEHLLEEIGSTILLEEPLDSITEELYRIESYEDQNSDDFFYSIQKTFDEDRLTLTYDRVNFLIRDLLFLKKTRALKDHEIKLYDYLLSLKAEFSEIKHPDAASYVLVYDLIKNLSGPISKQIILERHGVNSFTLGHLENRKLAKRIEAGELDAFYFLNQTNRFSKILLKRAYIPGKTTLYIGDRTNIPQPRSDELPALDPFDLLLANLPLKSFDEIKKDFMLGKILVKGYKEPVTVQTLKGRKQNIVSLLLVDESESMKGHRTEFAQSLISSFVDKTRKEVSDKLSHTVVVIPFSDDLGPIEVIKDNKEASHYMRSVLGSRSIMAKGTDIQKALVKAYEEIALSFADNSNINQKNKKVADLRKANIWLLTDGGSNINIEVLKAARAKIPQDVEVLLNIIFIGEENNDLKKFITTNFPDKSKLIQFVSDNQIMEFKEKSHENHKKRLNGEAFATDKNKSLVKGSLIDKVRRLSNFRSVLNLSNTYETKTVDNSKLIHDLGWSEDTGLDHDLFSFIKILEREKSSLVKDKDWEIILNRFLKRLEEREQLKSLDVLSYKYLSQIVGAYEKK